MLELFVTSIWNIANSLLSEYKDIKNAELGGRNKITVSTVNKTKVQYVSPHLSLNDIIDSK